MTGKSYDDGTQDQVFVFAIPAFSTESSSPSVTISTSSQIPVNVTLSISNTLKKRNTTVDRNSPSNIVLPPTIRLRQEEGKQNKTVIIISTGMVSVHALNDGENGDGFVVYPTSQLGKRYYVAAYAVNTAVDPSFVCISAVENTEIIVKRRTAEPFKVRLEEYESYRLDGYRMEDLSGTLIQSDKPIAVISGVKTRVSSVCCLGVLLEQLLPVSGWRKKYFLAPYKGLNGFVYRIYTSNHSTAVNISRSRYNETKHEVEAERFLEENVKGDAIHVVSISSKEPIMIVQYLKGYSTNFYSQGNPSPSMIVVQPLTSFTRSVTFPVFENNLNNQTDHYINIIIECSHTTGLRYSRQISETDQLFSADRSMCCVRGRVQPGKLYSVYHTDNNVVFSVSVYAFGDTRTSSSYAYLANSGAYSSGK